MSELTGARHGEVYAQAATLLSLYSGAPGAQQAAQTRAPQSDASQQVEGRAQRQTEAQEAREQRQAEAQASREQQAAQQRRIDGGIQAEAQTQAETSEVDGASGRREVIDTIA